MLPDCGAKESGSCEKSLGSSQLGAFLEAKMERANLTSDAHKWQAVIKSGERGALYVSERRSEKCLSYSRPGSSCLWHLVQAQISPIIDNSSSKV